MDLNLLFKRESFKTSTLFSIGFILILSFLIASYNKIEGFIFLKGTSLSKDSDLETLRFLAYILGGYLLIWQIVLTNRRTKAAEKTAEAAIKTSQVAVDNAKATMENIKLIEKGQVQERFKNAIDQLGSNKDSVNLGAIYTLHHIAKESEILRKSVFDILCAYVRETTTKGEYQANKSPTIKIQSLLNLLFKEEYERIIYHGLSADLHGACLYGADLRKAFFNNANLNSSNLILADLNDAKLAGAKMEHAKLVGAKLAKADLRSAGLMHANLYDAILNFADLRETILVHANMRKTELHEAKVDESDITALLEAWDCEDIEEIMRRYKISVRKLSGETIFVLEELT